MDWMECTPTPTRTPTLPLSLIPPALDRLPTSTPTSPLSLIPPDLDRHAHYLPIPPPTHPRTAEGIPRTSGRQYIITY